MIEIKNLTFGFDEKPIINNLSLTMNDGDFLAVVGPNGTGKSSLIKCLLGINKVKHNTILIDNQCISCYNQYNKFGYVAQAKPGVSELPITAFEIFKLILNDTSKIDRVSELLGITSILHKNMNQLSGGQKQRIQIAKAMLLDIKYLILDEPTTGLDLKSRIELNKVLEDLHKLGVTIIVVSHYISELEGLMTCKLDLENGLFERIK